MDEPFSHCVRPSLALERLGTALSDPIRQTILLRLTHGPAFPSELAELVDTSRSNLSNHLACLRGCGLVVAERQGRNVRYELVTGRLGEALATIEQAVTEASVAVGHGH
ncbi:MAG: metalloregulator ArsR/SmtB family transcription factor [Acidimicrobiia bacterium]|nr:metalloregulator ArsR/SmtB family transcription factor [Acidimicrobiia bacterium]